jgi:hypothetical protein
MPTIRDAEQTARSRLRRKPGTSDVRAQLREAVVGLGGDEVLEIRPEGAETMRGLKVNVSRAGKESSIDVTYGETVDGALLVWRPAETGRRRRRQGGNQAGPAS